MYVSASRPQVRSQAMVSPRVTTSSRTRPPSHAPLPTPQTPSRSCSQPAGWSTNVELSTPPPTTSTSRDPRQDVATTQPQSVNRLAIQSQPANRRQQRGQAPSIPPNQFVTPLYPLLLETGMLDHFRIHNGISRRSKDSEFTS